MVFMNDARVFMQVKLTYAERKQRVAEKKAEIKAANEEDED